MTNTNSGIFTQHGPNGVFGRGGPPEDASAPPVDGDGTPLRETLVVAYPSPGHMRVARAIRHPHNPPGQQVEFQEEFRVPTPEEVALLATQGVTVGPGSMVQSQTAMMPPTQLGPTQPGIGGVGDAPGEEPGFPWVKVALGVAAGAAGFWAVNKWVLPRFAGDEDDGDEGAVDDEGED